MRRLTIAKNSVVEIQNLVVNHESRHIKSNPTPFQTLANSQQGMQLSHTCTIHILKSLEDKFKIKLLQNENIKLLECAYDLLIVLLLFK